MRFDGIDFNVEKCIRMGKETFVNTFCTVFYLHLSVGKRKKRLSDIYDLMKG